MVARKTIYQRWDVFKSFVGWEDLIAILLIFIGALGYFQGPVPYIPHLTDFFIDIRSDLIGIGITVLIIDNVNELYRRRAEKERLILQMGSPDHGFAIEAARQMRSRGWLNALGGANMSKADLSDTRLSGANLSGSNFIGANLSGAVLLGVDLSKADLRKASLKKADLRGANLSEANLHEANLSGAYLIGMDLRLHAPQRNIAEADEEPVYLRDAQLDGADLSEADLSQAFVTDVQLSLAASLEGAIMPDGQVYDPEIHSAVADLRRKANK